MKRTINDVPVDKLAIIVAGLVREGVGFEVHALSEKGDYFYIELTGGY